MSTGMLSPFTVAAPSPASASGASGAGTDVVVVVVAGIVVGTGVTAFATGAVRVAVFDRDGAVSVDSSLETVPDAVADVVVGVTEAI